VRLLADKLVRRHPHVFGDVSEPGQPANAEEVLGRWEEIKREERKRAGHPASDRPSSSLDGVPKTLPSLLRAFQIQARASRVGFDWPHTSQGREQVFGKITEELEELRAALDEPSSTAPDPRVEAEFGDVLFALVNLARALKVNPEEALRKAVNRFAERFRYIESQAARSGRPLDEMTLAEMDVLWEEAKQRQG
jgi:tetrapyrrole methylase family protein/MazG family protein